MPSIDVHPNLGEPLVSKASNRHSVWPPDLIDREANARSAESRRPQIDLLLDFEAKWRSRLAAVVGSVADLEFALSGVNEAMLLTMLARVF